jgi:uncharacterized protein (TIGR02996 family)
MDNGPGQRSDNGAADMTNENTFLRAIRAEPDDTALRLAYADWLEERGDVRGEYIRLESALAAKPGAAPSVAGKSPG